MKIIHTADLHLGNTMHEIDRREEELCFFKWLKEKIEEEKAELLIISGDVFDTINPSNNAKTEYYDFLDSLEDTCCNNVIITGGNHDSPWLLEAAKNILKRCRVHVIGSISEKSVKDWVIPLFDRNSKLQCVCCALPYIRDNELREYYSKQADEYTQERAYEMIYRESCDYALSLINALSPAEKVPVISAGHLFASDLEGRYSSENKSTNVDDGIRDIVGNLGKIGSCVFDGRFDYTALGHIHYSTKVSGNEKIRYSGSPFILGFDETSIPHGVLSVNVECSQSPDVKLLVFKSPLIFKRVEGKAEEIKNELLKLDSECKEKKTFVEICYESEAGKNVHDFLKPYIEDKKFSVVSWKLKNKSNLLYNKYEDNGENAKEISMEDIFRAFILSRIGIEEGKNVDEKIVNTYMDMFKWAAEEVKNENPEN